MITKYFLPTILCLSLLFLSLYSRASHNLGGQIYVTQLSDSSYQISLHTYTDPAPANVDRCAADIEIWKNDPIPTLITTIQNIPRRNGPLMTIPPSDCQLTGPNIYNGEVYYGSVKKNIYDTTFTFLSPGLYELRYFDIARHGATVNMDNPEEQSIYLETKVNVSLTASSLDAPTLLLNEGGIAPACIGQLWTHNPGGYDADCDSLVYELVPAMHYDPSQSSQAQIVTGYLWPDDPSFGISTFSMDPQTGFLSWTPPQLGIYALAYRISTYRNGILRQQILREISIWVADCDNQSPVIQANMPTCVYAGDTAIFSFKVYDPDPTDSLYLGLNNGNFQDLGLFADSVNAPQIIAWYVDTAGNVQSFTQFPFPVPEIDTVFVTIEWIVPCYLAGKTLQLDLYAHDNMTYALPNNFSFMLTGNFAGLVQVNYPRVAQPEAMINYGNGKIELTWIAPTCSLPVAGYNIYRLINGMPDTLDCCETGDYQQVGTILGNGPLFFSELPPLGLQQATLCYFVTANYDFIESCPSEKACVDNYTTTISSDVPNEWEIRILRQDNRIEIRSIGMETIPFSYDLINIHGQELLKVLNQTGNSTVQMTAHSTGIYFLRISMEGRHLIKKILW